MKGITDHVHFRQKAYVLSSFDERDIMEYFLPARIIIAGTAFFTPNHMNINTPNANLCDRPHKSNIYLIFCYEAKQCEIEREENFGPASDRANSTVQRGTEANAACTSENFSNLSVNMAVRISSFCVSHLRHAPATDRSVGSPRSTLCVVYSISLANSIRASQPTTTIKQSSNRKSTSQCFVFMVVHWRSIFKQMTALTTTLTSASSRQHQPANMERVDRGLSACLEPDKSDK